MTKLPGSPKKVFEEPATFPESPSYRGTDTVAEGQG